MGYCMEMLDMLFRIEAEHKPAALEAIKRAIVYDDPRSEYTYRGSIGWAWMKTSTILAARTLEEALVEARWKPLTDANGTILAIEFTGEKMGNEQALFNAIAPFVKKGSRIHMEGEDGDRWEWVFSGEDCEWIPVGNSRYMEDNP